MSEKETKSADKGAKNTRAKSKPNGTSRKATGDELLEAIEAESWESVKPRTSSLAAFRDIILVGGLLAVGAWFYYQHVTVKAEVAKLVVRAADFMEKDDIVQLKKAEKIYLEALALDDDNPIILSALAETYFHLDRHGLNKLADSESFQRKAEAVEAKTPERYANSAYIKIKKGQAGAAAADIKALLDQKVYSPKLAHAYGWALMEQGDYLRANQVLAQSIETDFNAIRFSLTLAEVAHRQGKERAALKSLSKILQRGMNPDHAIALGWSAALRAKNYGNLARTAQYLADLQKLDATLSPVGKAYKAWAEGEFNLALLKPDVAIEKADEASKLIGIKFAPFIDMKARALQQQGKNAEAIAAFEEGIAALPKYRGLAWGLAKLKSSMGDDAALDLVAAIEKTEKGFVGAEFEIFRGDHYLKKGKLEEAKAAYTKAADLGNDAEILLGIARVAFYEEKAKGNKADIEKVSEKLQEAFDARRIFPELNELMADISLWNFQVPAADKAFMDAEDQYKKLKTPVPVLVEFFDRTINTYDSATEKQVKKDAAKMVKQWKQRKADYLASVIAGMN